MSEEQQAKMIIQDDAELDEKIRKLIMNDATVYVAYKTANLLGMSKTNLYANMVLLLAHEKQVYFDMALHAKSTEIAKPYHRDSL